MNAVGDTMIEISNLSHRYGRTLALGGVTLALGSGITGLVGPNGAGKSSLLGCIATALPVQSGKILVGGHDVAIRQGRSDARRLLGFLPQRFDLVGSLRVQDTVAYAAWASGVPEEGCAEAATKSLAIVELTQKSRDRVGSLSGGQRQRLGIACAIAHDPEVVILDEPTVGLDPDTRVKMREHIASIGQTRTVVVSTHLIEDIVRVSDQLVVLDHGHVVYQGGTRALAELGTSGANQFTSPLEVAYKRLLKIE